MYNQPTTGISGWVYIFLGAIAGLAWVGKKLISYGKSLTQSITK